MARRRGGAAIRFAPRFAKAAAELLGVDGVRLYHDQALFKEPGGGHTPWHQDRSTGRSDTEKTITMWMPLADLDPAVGSMTFATGGTTAGELRGTRSPTRAKPSSRPVRDERLPESRTARCTRATRRSTRAGRSTGPGRTRPTGCGR